ncbi:antirepressor protein [Citrobacter freundii]|uniref:BRO-N domain-containing protein n=1 Tax=Citrobacter freundii TaxID=546 RepID=UPI0015E92D04|nr:BRO family protein [Citrobacter freundii]QMJ04907.1 antirepressor protein [Citrobacter freundii]QMJ13972.1 antirepressor protein [Citrobacter freundii]
MKNNMTLAGQGLAHPEASQKDIYRASESDISVIRSEGAKVRIVKISGEPWFVAADVCKALEIGNPSKAVAALDGDENTLTSIQGIHAGPGNPVINVVAESGFYKLIARSRKATTPGTFAHRFSNWVFRQVIPSIRKTGSYGVPFAFLNDFTRRKAQYTRKASKRGHDLQACRKEKESLSQEEAQLWRDHQPQLPEVEGEADE